MKRDQQPPAPDAGLLATLPLGALLARVLRLVLCQDRREEFLGDLIEEANLRLPDSSRTQLSIWLWTQALRSLPLLLGLRVRRWAAAAPALVAHLFGGQQPGRTGAGVLVGSRVVHRGWPLSLAVSVAAHALVLVGALAILFARVEELEPVRTPLDLLAAFVPEPVPLLVINDAGGQGTTDDQQPPARRRRPARRTVVSPGFQPATAFSPGSQLPGAASPPTTSLSAQPPAADAMAPAGPPAGASSVALPPRVAEKRCVACPIPQLTPAYADLARGQDMIVRTCVSARGEVTSVDVLRGFDSTVNREVTATIRHWRLVPYLLDGHPVPFCYPTRFIFASR